MLSEVFRPSGGLTVRPVIAGKAAPVSDLDQTAGNIFAGFPEFSPLKD